MSQPLYFLPGVSREQLAGLDITQTNLNRALLAERGLADTFADVGNADAVAYELHETPAGKSGCMLFYKRPDGRAPICQNYKPTSQTWHTVNAGLMIGIENDAPPTPDDLRRKKMSKGIPVELSEQDFTIPIIRRIDGLTTLPTQMFMDEAGNVLRPVQAKYTDLWERFSDVSEWLFAKQQALSAAALLTFAVDALSINYRVSMKEQSALRIIDGETFFDILVVAVDFGTAQELQEAQKKTASLAAAPNTTHGSEDSCQVTPPVLANSTLQQ